MSLGNLCSVKWLFDITSRTFIKISPPDFFHHINMFSRIPLLFGKLQASLVLTKTKISIFPRTSSFTWSNLFLKEFILEWPMTNLLLTFTRNFLVPKKNTFLVLKLCSSVLFTILILSPGYMGGTFTFIITLWHLFHIFCQSLSLE